MYLTCADMFIGFVISAICELERNAIQLALGSFYPTLLLSGKLMMQNHHGNRLYPEVNEYHN
jgi:hypothetical protein